MKVLALVPDYVEKPSGGLGEQYRHIINELEDKVEYYTVGYPEQNSIKNYKSALNPIPSFNHASLTTIFGQSIYLLKGLEYKENFDIIHAFDWSTFYAGIMCKWHFKKPLVCTVQLSLKQLNNSNIFYCHDINSIDGQYINKLQVDFEKLGLSEADKVIHVSKYYEDLYPEFKFKSSVINNGLDINSWVKKRTPNLPGKNKTKFCYIGRAAVMKGIDTILNCNIPDDVDLYFVVSPKNAESNLLNLIKNKCNNKNIFYIPGLYGQDKIDFLFSMDSIIIPSKHEPFGIVVLEALISNNVLITTASGGIQEIVDGTKYLQITTSKDLECAMREVAKLTEDEKTNIITINREKALQYTWASAADKLYNVYTSLF